eukprot:TRINITY_DN6302_c0_g1_i1.p1 TRINITY_DN6302_c0_g1~~TRINITY_DN6302_c0_g1_i1.p1  ORF type:complete len:270 (-),score=21.30 TRINITY_DN6302_c0_g1_i1:97-906(-)
MEAQRLSVEKRKYLGGNLFYLHEITRENKKLITSVISNYKGTCCEVIRKEVSVVIYVENNEAFRQLSAQLKQLNEEAMFLTEDQFLRYINDLDFPVREYKKLFVGAANIPSAVFKAAEKVILMLYTVHQDEALVLSEYKGKGVWGTLVEEKIHPDLGQPENLHVTLARLRRKARDRFRDVGNNQILGGEREHFLFLKFSQTLILLKEFESEGVRLRDDSSGFFSMTRYWNNNVLCANMDYDEGHVFPVELFGIDETFASVFALEKNKNF